MRKSHFDFHFSEDLDYQEFDEKQKKLIVALNPPAKVIKFRLKPRWKMSGPVVTVKLQNKYDGDESNQTFDPRTIKKFESNE